MKKMVIGFVSIVLLVVVLYLGYSTISTLNGEPLAMHKAEKLGNEYIKQRYFNENLIISDGEYAKNFGNYNFNVTTIAGKKVNELVIQEGLETIEDTNLTRDLNEKVKQYISNSNLSVDKMEVNGTVFFTADNLNRNDTIWITFAGEDLSTEKVAKFGKDITIWSKETGLSLNKLIIDFTNLSTNKSSRLYVDDNQIESQDFLEFID
ncbi:hypothetical protein [Evansella tamaricis]|uniref:YfjL-like N-terminal domain-containing protein n=1 Tax=Evansella tamaricis TaxID=2069301 RepID=A0ABS6JH81_9BACI|nr:hypothetical protein [Evansella tamaricis]MBU9712755.1 hypothetical protein [Evansella tamaricis]